MYTLNAFLRDKSGTGDARALRRAGLVPAIIYGADKKNLSISVNMKEIDRHYKQPFFKSTVIQLEIGGKNHKVLPKAVQLHPITDIVRHVDFVYLGQGMQVVSVPIVFDGKDRAIGVKKGGFFNIVKRYLKLSSPVDQIPQSVVVDVSKMSIGRSMKASDVVIPDCCKLLDRPDLIVASIVGKGSDKDDATNTTTAEKSTN